MSDQDILDGVGNEVVYFFGEWSWLWIADIIIRAANVYQLFGDVFTITEKAPTRTFSLLKAPSSASTFRHYAKKVLAHGN